MLFKETAVLITKLTVFSLADENIRHFIAIRVYAVWFSEIQLHTAKRVGKIFATKGFFFVYTVEKLNSVCLEHFALFCP